ncbi:MAG: hypothetical protein Q8O39_02345 [bacterium]|nr:hypothetical protein [bacterium]
MKDPKSHGFVVVDSGHYLTKKGEWKRIPPNSEGIFPDDALRISMLKKPVATGK